MGERVGKSRLKVWFHVNANRLHLSIGLTVGVFVAFVAVVSTVYPPFVQHLQSGDMIDTLFSTMITVIVTGATLVVTIGQVILTQENGPLGDQKNRMENAMDVRTSIGEVTGSPSPTDPAAFLGEIVDAAAQRATALRESIDGGFSDGGERPANEDVRSDIETLTDEVTENAELMRDQLEGATFGSFGVLSAALNYNYSWKIYQIEHIESTYAGALTEHQHDLLNELKTVLSLYGPVREHIKTLYFQWALIDLSQLILYAAVPAVTVAGIMVAIVGPGTFPGSTFGIDHILLVVGAAFAVTLLPFLLFVAYVLRILTVAKRTLAIGPLILRDSE